MEELDYALLRDAVRFYAREMKDVEEHPKQKEWETISKKELSYKDPYTIKTTLKDLEKHYILLGNLA